MNLESNTVTVKRSAKDIFEHFSQLKNFEQLMPESIQKFEVDGDSFLFALKGMPEIRLVLKEKTPNTNITLGAASDKFPFTLAANITEVNADESTVQLVFNGSFNPMMAMMVKKPLSKFIDTLSENISKF